MVFVTLTDVSDVCRVGDVRCLGVAFWCYWWCKVMQGIQNAAMLDFWDAGNAHFERNENSKKMS